MIYKFNEVILITLYDFDETTDEAVLVRVEGAKTPAPPLQPTPDGAQKQP